jgi:hypothetical protein
MHLNESHLFKIKFYIGTIILLMPDVWLEGKIFIF